MFNAGLAIGIGIAAHAYYVALIVLGIGSVVGLSLSLIPIRKCRPFPVGSQERSGDAIGT